MDRPNLQIIYKDEESLSLIKKAGRKKADFVAYAIQEFAEKYGISQTVSHDELLKFLKMYPYIKGKINGQIPLIPVQQTLIEAPPTNMETPKDESSDISSFFDKRKGESEKIESLVSEEDASDMENVLASFFS